LGRADALVVLTGWPEFAGVDYEEMKSYMAKPVILDGVNLFDPERMQEAGFTYEGFGQ